MPSITTYRSVVARAPRPAVSFLLLLAMVFSCLPLSAQSAWVRGGTSTLMNASGVQLDYRWAPVQGWFGVGFADGAVGGGYLGMRYRRFDVGVGDRYQGLGLETDIFDGGRYFSGRGVYVTNKGENQSWTAFVGATSEERSFSFFRAFEAQQATAAWFYSRRSGKIEVSSFTIAQNKISSIHSVQYTATPDLKLSIAGGIGYNSPYASAAARFKRRKFMLDAAYIAMGESFQRISGLSTNGPEHVGANLRFAYQPNRRLGISLSHENLFSPVLREGDRPLRVSMNTAGVNTSLRGFNLGVTASQSKSGAIDTRMENINISRDITRSIAASGALMRLELNTGTANILIGNLREKISPRLSLNQGITKQGSQNNLTFGGRFVSNRITVGVQHDMVYSTLAGGFRGRSSMHVWTFNVTAQLFRGISIHTDSMVDPTGKVRYTAWADGIGIGKMDSGEQGRPTQSVPSFSKFVVKGIVQDTDGKPVWGISVHVDGQNAYSDNAGRFFLRFRRGEQYPVSIVPEQSLNTMVYRIVRAPVSALAEPEDQAQTIIIVVERDLKYQEPPKRKRSEIETPDESIQGGGLQADSTAPVPYI